MVQRKNYFSLVMVFVGLLMISCSNKNDQQSAEFLASVKNIEKVLGDSISSDSKVVKIIAYNTYKAQIQDDMAKIKELAKITQNTAKRQYIFAKDGSFYRVYYPITDAIIQYEQRNIPTNEKGALVSASPIPMSDVTLLELAGKYGKITPEEKEEGKERPIQFLRTSIQSEKKLGNSIHTEDKICVFNLGERKLGEKISWE